MHAFLLEFGVSVPKSTALIKGLSKIIERNEFPPYLESLRQKLREHYDYFHEKIKDLETQLKASLNEDGAGQRVTVYSFCRPVDCKPALPSIRRWKPIWEQS